MPDTVFSSIMDMSFSQVVAIANPPIALKHAGTVCERYACHGDGNSKDE